jgi:hypothetical protein
MKKILFISLAIIPCIAFGCNWSAMNSQMLSADQEIKKYAIINDNISLVIDTNNNVWIYYHDNLTNGIPTKKTLFYKINKEN